MINDQVYYSVMGFIKAGQNACVTYLQHKLKDPNLRKAEIAYAKDGMERFLSYFNPDTHRIIPVFILRDPIDRMWSAYHYFDHYKTLSFSAYLKIRKYAKSWGEENPVSGSNYSKWMKPYMKYNPLILELEEMRKNPSFPKENATNVSGYSQNDMPIELRELAETALKIECEIHKEPSWSIDEDYEMPW